MSLLILLDSGPLGMITNPKPTQENLDCTNWLQSRLAHANRIFIPEIIDYEIRRELIRANKRTGLRNLNNLISTLEYLPLSTAAMRQAAEFWAHARKNGIPTTNSTALDVDVILAAQAATLLNPNVVIATTNAKHLSRFINAKLWQEIED